MRALTLSQPWATLVIEGHKRIETRSWMTEYRGPLVIHAGVRMGPDERGYAEEWGLVPDSLPRGAAIGTVRLVGCVLFDERHERWQRPEGEWILTDRERSLGDFTAGRYGWLLASPEEFAEPVPVKGALGLWRYEGSFPERVCLAQPEAAEVPA